VFGAGGLGHEAGGLRPPSSQGFSQNISQACFSHYQAFPGCTEGWMLMPTMLGILDGSRATPANRDAPLKFYHSVYHHIEEGEDTLD
jgi:hypothetical protein